MRAAMLMTRGAYWTTLGEFEQRPQRIE